MADELFDRRAIVQMDTIKVTGLRVAFNIEKDAEPEPNPAEISVWNMAKKTRTKMLDRTIPLILQAGYVDNIEQIFIGDIRPNGVSTVRDGGDWITTFKAGDGDNAHKARIQESFAKGAKPKDVLKKIMEKVEEHLSGNKSLAAKLADKVADAIKAGKQGGIDAVLSEFFGGTTVSGSAVKEVERLLKGFGYGYSIQDGHQQVVEDGSYTDDDPVLLTPDTGLIGTPEPGSDLEIKNAVGKVIRTRKITKFRSLLQPRLKPLHRAKIKTPVSKYDGIYVINKVNFNGDTHGQNWYADCEGWPL